MMAIILRALLYLPSVWNMSKMSSSILCGIHPLERENLILIFSKIVPTIDRALHVELLNCFSFLASQMWGTACDQAVKVIYLSLVCHPRLVICRRSSTIFGKILIPNQEIISFLIDITSWHSNMMLIEVYVCLLHKPHIEVKLHPHFCKVTHYKVFCEKVSTMWRNMREE